MARAPREEIRTLLTTTFNEGTLKRGQVGFDHIIKDYGDKGTTCGFLVHWMLWRMGCADKKLVQRDEPDDSCHFHAGQGISAVSEHRAFTGGPKVSPQQVAERLFDRGAGYTLSCGDIVIVKGANFDSGAGSEHIFVVLDTKSTGATALELDIAQAGGGIGAKGQSGERRTIKVSLETKEGQLIGKDARKGSFAMIGSQTSVGARPIIGYMNVDDLEWGPARAGFGLKSLTDLSGQPTNVALERALHDGYANRVGSVWSATTEEGPRYYVFYKGHRVFSVSADAPSNLSRSGAWFADHGNLRIVWDDTGAGEMYWAGQGTPVKALEGFAVSGQSRTLTKIAERSFPPPLRGLAKSSGATARH